MHFPNNFLQKIWIYKNFTIFVSQILVEDIMNIGQNSKQPIMQAVYPFVKLLFTPPI